MSGRSSKRKALEASADQTQKRKLRSHAHNQLALIPVPDPTEEPTPLQAVPVPLQTVPEEALEDPENPMIPADKGREWLLSGGAFIKQVLIETGALDIVDNPPAENREGARDPPGEKTDIVPFEAGSSGPMHDTITVPSDPPPQQSSQVARMSQNPTENPLMSGVVQPGNQQSETHGVVERNVPILEEIHQASSSRQLKGKAPMIETTLPAVTGSLVGQSTRPVDMSTGELQAVYTVSAGQLRGSSPYPDPRLVITDAADYSMLIESGLLDSLKQIPVNPVLACGKRTIRTAVTSCELEPRDQLQVAVCAKFFSSLSKAGADNEVFELIHSGYWILEGKRAPGDFSKDEIKKAWEFLDREDMESLVEILAQLLFRSELLRNPYALEGLNASELVGVMSELANVYPESLVVYDMLFHLVKGGERCVVPIPDLCRAHPVLGAYIDKISCGNSLLRAADIPIEPRIRELPYASVLSPSLGISPGTMVPESLPPPPPRPSRVSYYGGGQGIQPPRPKEPVGSSRLLAQGAQKGDPTARNTYNFQTALAADEEMKRVCAQLLSQMGGLINVVNTMSVNIGRIEEKITKIESALSDILTHGSHRSLTTSASINRTLLTQTSPEAQNIIIHGPPLAPLVATNVQQLITRIQNFKSVDADPEIIEDLRAVYREAGEVTAANALVEQSFSTPAARRRMVTKLRGMSVK